MNSLLHERSALAVSYLDIMWSQEVQMRREKCAYKNSGSSMIKSSRDDSPKVCVRMRVCVAACFLLLFRFTAIVPLVCKLLPK